MNLNIYWDYCLDYFQRNVKSFLSEGPEREGSTYYKSMLFHKLICQHIKSQEPWYGALNTYKQIMQAPRSFGIPVKTTGSGSSDKTY